MSDVSINPQPKQGLSRFSIAVIVVVLFFLVLIGWGIWRNEIVTRPEIGEPAPNVEMSFFEGYYPNAIDASELNLEDLEGKVVVLNFWASWCIECRVEMPDLQNIAVTYPNDVEVVGVAYIDVESQSLEFLEEFGITYANAPDLGSRISDVYQLTGVPETFIIDQEGNIAALFIGPVTGEQLDSVISQLIAEN